MPSDTSTPAAASATAAAVTPAAPPVVAAAPAPPVAPKPDVSVSIPTDIAGVERVAEGWSTKTKVIVGAAVLFVVALFVHFVL